MSHRKQNSGVQISRAYIQKICVLYDDLYDDRSEDSRPPTAGSRNGQADKRPAGADWEPGTPAGHKSLNAFQKELSEKHGIHLSTSKIRKILVSGGLWTTERSREIQALYVEMTQTQSGIDPEQVVSLISKQLGVSKPTVVVNLPYINGVNRLDHKSTNAQRCAKYRKKKQESSRQTANKRKTFRL